MAVRQKIQGRIQYSIPCIIYGCTTMIPRLKGTDYTKPGGSEMCEDCEEGVMERISAAREIVVEKRKRKSVGRRTWQRKAREYVRPGTYKLNLGVLRGVWH